MAPTSNKRTTTRQATQLLGPTFGGGTRRFGEVLLRSGDAGNSIHAEIRLDGSSGLRRAISGIQRLAHATIHTQAFHRGVRKVPDIPLKRERRSGRTTSTTKPTRPWHSLSVPLTRRWWSGTAAGGQRSWGTRVLWPDQDRGVCCLLLADSARVVVIRWGRRHLRLTRRPHSPVTDVRADSGGGALHPRPKGQRVRQLGPTCQ
jgi:hypothetical protein